MARAVIVLVVGVLLGAGCGIARMPPPVSRPGASDGIRLERLGVAAGRVLGPGPVDVGLAGSPGLGAWAWPDGRIRVTPALVDLLAADELAAVVAHERGHLQAHDARADAAAIGGDARGLEAEIRADEAGCAILAARGVAPDAMVRMLEILARGSGLEASARIAAAARACGAWD